jgi:quercetin dioxygenase-like cupin family protein
MFCLPSDTGFTPVLEGISIKTLVHGPETLLTEFRLEAGRQLPLHGHPHEQTGYLVSGRMRLTIGGRALELGPGAAWCVPSGVEHGAEILEDSVAVEVFSPCREDYLRFLDGEAIR